MCSYTHKHSFLACPFLAQFSYIYHVQISMRKHCIVLRVAAGLALVPPFCFIGQGLCLQCNYMKHLQGISF